MWRPQSTAHAAGGGSHGTILQLIALFFLLLAMFILLVSQSDYSQDRVAAVLRSMDRSFSGDGLGADGTDDGGRESARARVARDLVSLGSQVPGLLPLARTASPGLGDTLILNLPESDLFSADGLIRNDRSAALERLADVLSSRPGGVQVQAELLFSSASETTVDSEGSVRSGNRAGLLARTLTAAGAPASGISIGIERGTPGDIRMLFRIIDRDPVLLSRERLP